MKRAAEVLTEADLVTDDDDDDDDDTDHDDGGNHPPLPPAPLLGCVVCDAGVGAKLRWLRRGPCWRLVAYCPSCRRQLAVLEHREPPNFSWRKAKAAREARRKAKREEAGK